MEIQTNTTQDSPINSYNNKKLKKPEKTIDMSQSIVLKNPTTNYINLANQTSATTIFPDIHSSINTENITTETLAPFIEKDQQQLYLEGSSKNTYEVKTSKELNTNNIKQELPYTLSTDGKLQTKPADILSRSQPIPSIPYITSESYTTEKQLIKNLKKDNSLLPPSYWERKESYNALVENSGEITGYIGGTLGAIGGGIGGAAAGTLIAGPGGTATGSVLLGTAGGVAGEVYGTELGEEVIAPVINYFTDDIDPEHSNLVDHMKDVFNARFDGKWEQMDIMKTMKLYPQGPHQEALYEAYIERPKHRTSYSPLQLEELQKTTDKAGNDGHLLPGSDPKKRPNIGLDITGKPVPVAIIGAYGDMFLNEVGKKDLIRKKDDGIELSNKERKNVAEITKALRRSGLAVLPRVEVFFDLETKNNNLIVYIRPNQIAGLLNDKSLGKHIKEEIKKLPLSIRNLNDDNVKKKLDTLKDPMNSGFRLSIPIPKTASIEGIGSALKNSNIGYFFERNIASGAPRRLLNEYGLELMGAVVIRTIPTNSLHKYPQGTTYFTSAVSYIVNEADVSQEGVENRKKEASEAKEKKTKKAKDIQKAINNFGPALKKTSKLLLKAGNTGKVAVETLKYGVKKATPTIIKTLAKAGNTTAKTIGTALAHANPPGLYFAAGATVNLGTIDNTGKVINENGQEVYTSNINLGLEGGFISTSEEKNPNDYYQTPLWVTEALDSINREGK